MSGSDIGTAWVTVLPDVSKFGRELNKGVTKSAGSAGASAGTSAGRGFGRSIMSTVAGLGIGLGIGKTIGTGLQTAMDTELANIKFTQLLGTKEKAQAFITDLQGFAARTPFDFPGLQDAASRFLAVGVEADKVIPIMTTLGDATSIMGTGAAGIDRATTALTQMQQKGKVTGEEMMQLTEAGIPAWEALASSMGMSVPEVQNLVSKGLVPAEEMFTAIETGSGDALGAMAGGMDKASQTLAGQWSTLKDTASQTLGALFGIIVPPLSTALGWITTTMIPGLQTFADKLYEWRVPLAVIAGVITAIFLPMLITSGIIIVSTMASIAAGWVVMAAQAVVSAAILAVQWLIAFWPVFLVIAIVLALVAVIWYFWDEIKAALSAAWSWITSVFTAIWSAIVGFVQGVWNAVKPIWDTLWNLLTLPIRVWWTIVSAIVQLAWAGLKAVFTKILNTVKPIWDGLWGGIKSVVQGVINWIGPKVTAIKDTVVGAFTAIKTKATEIWNGIKGIVSGAVSAISGFASGIWSGIKGTINTGIRLLNTAISGFNSVIGTVNKVPGVNVPTIPKIPQLAAGGIVTRPTLALVGEAGPEAVIPLDRYRAQNGPTQVDVRVYVGDSEITDIVRVEVNEHASAAARAINAGRRP